MFESAFFLALIGNRLVEVFVKPFFDKFELDKFWLMPVAWVMCGALGALSGLNLFADFFANPAVGQVLTAIVVGGGSNLLHDVFKK